MDEKIKDQGVLLVKDQKGENLKAVTGTDEKGGLKTVPPTAEHEQSLLKFDKHSNALENFLSNFMRQFKHPTPLTFFKVPFESAVASARVLSEMLKAPDVPSNKEMLDSARINPADYAGECTNSVHYCLFNCIISYCAWARFFISPSSPLLVPNFWG